MSNPPATPTSKSTYVPATPTTRLAGSHALHSSPHYTTTRRHSLYGVEDRVIIDPGSRIWKVGFSGEGKPRNVLYAVGPNDTLWKLSRHPDPQQRAEEEKMLEIHLQKCLRSVYHDSLMTDPKARKVILVEHPLLPMHIKELMARILFENQVPSVSFASSHLLSLIATGRITGLVIDCGHLEAVALPIFASRPLFPLLKTTPLAGARLTEHLHALILMFATYLPPLSSLGSTVTVPPASRATRVPQEILTDELVDDIKVRCCFVSDILGDIHEEDSREATPTGDDISSEPDVPSSDYTTQSESEFSQSESMEYSQSQETQSQEDSEVSETRLRAPSSMGSVPSEGHLQGISNLYKRHSTASDIRLQVTPPQSQQTGTGLGTLIIPGWVRERAAEVLFEGGDIDELSLAEVILEVLLKTPVDLRKTLACSIVVTGGTAMLPGFIPRLHDEILRALQPPMIRPRHPVVAGKAPPPVYDRYETLRPLVPYFSILNNPSPRPPTSSRAAANAGKAPAYTPALLAWVGGSLAGSLKTGGAEVSRERWDEVDAEAQNVDEDESINISPEPIRSARSILPDWTSSPIPNIVTPPPTGIKHFSPTHTVPSSSSRITTRS